MFKVLELKYFWKINSQSQKNCSSLNKEILLKVIWSKNYFYSVIFFQKFQFFRIFELFLIDAKLSFYFFISGLFIKICFRVIERLFQRSEFFVCRTGADHRVNWSVQIFPFGRFSRNKIIFVTQILVPAGLLRRQLINDISEIKILTLSLAGSLFDDHYPWNRFYGKLYRLITSYFFVIILNLIFEKLLRRKKATVIFHIWL